MPTTIVAERACRNVMPRHAHPDAGAEKETFAVRARAVVNDRRARLARRSHGQIKSALASLVTIESRDAIQPRKRLRPRSRGSTASPPHPAWRHAGLRVDARN